MHRADTIAICQTAAVALIALADYRRARQLLEQALSLCCQPEATIDVLAILGNLHRLQGDYAPAEEQLRRAVALAEREDADGPQRAVTRNALGILCKDTGRYEEAGRHYEAALANGPEPQLRATILHNLAGLEHAAGRNVSAEPHARTALEIRTALLGADHPDVAADRAVLGAVLHSQQRNSEAEKEFHRALDVFQHFYGSRHYEVAVNHANLAAVYADTGRLEAAEAAYLRALAIKRTVLGQNHPEIAALENNLAVVCERLNRGTEARGHFMRAAEIFTSTLGPGHPTTRASLDNATRLQGPAK